MATTPAQGSPKKYFAFLSYGHKDSAEAARLARFIETFRVPVKLGGIERSDLPKRMFPVFRDRDELSASPSLGGVIEEALSDSGALIVLCAPEAAASTWVNKEIREFRRVGDANRIFAVILRGEPSVAFPEALTETGVDPLAVDFRPHVDKPRDAHLRLIAALLGVDFDALKRREALRVRNARLRIAAFATIAALATAGSIAGYNSDQPHFIDFISVTGSPNAIAVGPGRALWFTEYVSGGSGFGEVGRITVDGRLSEYLVGANVNLRDIAAGPDGAMWFTEQDANKIGRIGADGHIDEFSLPGKRHEGISGPVAIAAGPDHALWFTEGWIPGEGLSGTIGRISTTGKIAEYRIPSGMGAVGNLVAGPDGALWFRDGNVIMGVARIGRVTANGHIAEYPVPTTNINTGDLVAGPDHALWFTESRVASVGPPGKIARISMSGHIREYQVPNQPNVPSEIVVGRDRALWFSDGGELGRLTVAGRFSHYPIPGARVDATSVTVGPGNALWFIVEGAGNSRAIGRIAMDGHLTEYQLPGGADATAIKADRDYALWFSESNGIGRITAGHWFFGM